MNSPRPIEPKTDLAAWLNKSLQYAKSTTNRSGKGVLTNNHPHGTLTSPKMDFGTNRYGVSYEYENYDKNKEYNVGIFVRVTASFTESFYNGSGYDSIPITQGTYISVAPVPPYFPPSSMSLIAAQIPASLTASYADCIRKPNWIYSPLENEPYATIDTYVSTSTGNYRTNQYRLWEKISGGATSVTSSGITLAPFLYNADGGDYIICVASGSTNPASGSGITGSSVYYIAKPYKLRTSITAETIAGVSHTFTYSPSISDSASFYTRTDSYGLFTETQTIVPPYIRNDVIYASPLTTGTIPAFSCLVTASLSAGGSSYAVNDVLTLDGCTPTAPIFKVTAVSTGSITGFTITNFGKVVTPPPSPMSVTGGAGSGALFNCTWTPLLIDTNLDARAWAH